MFLAVAVPFVEDSLPSSSEEEMNSCQSSVRSLIPFSEDFLSAHLKY